jgi:hypothetical protein
MGQIHYDGADSERRALCSVWRRLNEVQAVSSISARDGGGFSFYIADADADFRGYGGKQLESLVETDEVTGAVGWVTVERMGDLVIETTCHLAIEGAPTFVWGVATPCRGGGKKEASILRRALEDFKNRNEPAEDDIWTQGALLRLMPAEERRLTLVKR